jgi:hypothetical protein
MKFGDMEELSTEASKKARQVIWVPRLMQGTGATGKK